jgi:diacylglycerol kinase family enzyme
VARYGGRVLSLAVSNNLYLETPGLFLRRAALDSGKLGVYVSRHRSGIGLLWILAKAVFGSWKADPYLRSFEATELRVETRAARVKLTYDGEVGEFETPLTFRIAPGALKILEPPPP